MDSSLLHARPVLKPVLNFAFDLPVLGVFSGRFRLAFSARSMEDTSVRITEVVFSPVAPTPFEEFEIKMISTNVVQVLRSGSLIVFTLELGKL